MLLEVAPLRRFPRSLASFSYQVPAQTEYADQLAVGQLVEINFQTRPTWGVITKLNATVSSPSITIKPIIQIVRPEPVIAAAHLNFFYDVSAVYHGSSNWLLKNAVFKFTKKNISRFKTTTQVLPSSSSHTQSTTPTILTHATEEEKYAALLKGIHQSGTHLIIVPTIAALHDTYEKLKPLYSSRLLAVSSKMTQVAHTTAWFQAWSGEKDIIIGTRQAFFIPWPNLASIWVLNENSPEHKNFDSFPRFHAVDAAQILKHHYPTANLFFTSNCPSLILYKQASEKKMRLVGTRTIQSPPPNRTSVEIIDTRSREPKNHSSLSPEIEDLIQNRQKNIFFFCNRRGSARHIRCQDCQLEFVCTVCTNALVFHESNQSFYCHACESARDVPLQCPRCQSTSRRMWSGGTQAVAADIKKILAPSEKKLVIRIDNDDHAPHSLGSLPERSIIVGTTAALPHMPWATIEAAVAIDPDTLLTISEFNAQFELWTRLMDIKYRLGSQSQLLVVTSQPEHFLYSSLNNPHAFYEHELKERSRFIYPPFSFLVRLLTYGENQTHTEQTAIAIQRQLSQLTKDHKTITILPPVPSIPKIKAKKYCFIIIIKLPPHDWIDHLRRINQHIPFNCKVDPNPQSLLRL